VITFGQEDSDRLVEVPDPAPEAGEVPVQVLAVGVEGVDELASGQYGDAPEGEDQSVSVKAFENKLKLIQRRLTWQPQRTLVTGAGRPGCWPQRCWRCAG
jgi:hypothetical protein